MRPRVVTTRHIARGCGILADGAAQSRNPADLAGTMALVVGDSAGDGVGNDSSDVDSRDHINVDAPSAMGLMRQ